MAIDGVPRSSAVTANVGLAILLGGFAAGFLDIIFASVLSGATPDRVFKYIAGGWVGLAAARAGGAEMVVLGAASHFGIAWVAAAVYVFASKWLPVLRRQAIVFGLLYGAWLHVIMSFVVVPLSAIHRDPWATTLENFTINLIGQMILFGLPIALSAKRFMGVK